MKRLIFSLLLALFSTGAIAAEVVKYVNDYLLINLRSGPSTEYKIDKRISSGTRVTILEDNGAGYSRVRITGGLEGWVLNQYLVEQPVARLQLTKAQKDLGALQKKYSELKIQHNELSKQNKGTSNERGNLDKQVKKLSKELASLKKVAAKPIRLENENKQLISELVELKNSLRITEEKNAVLEDSEARQWFGVGAAVLFLGIILGLILPKLKSRRVDSWGGV